jgi:chemotaxis signal transduction protein
MQRLVVFQIGNRQLGVNMELTGSIETAAGLLEHQESDVLMINGEEVPLYDLAAVFGNAPSSLGPESRKVMLIRTRERRLALIVDRVDRVIEAESGEIAPLPPVFTGPALACFPRVLVRDGALIPLLSPEGMAGTVGIKNRDNEHPSWKRMHP